MISTTKKIDQEIKGEQKYKTLFCKTQFRKEYKDGIESDLGHIPSYDKEKKPIPINWYEPIKD